MEFVAISTGIMTLCCLIVYKISNILKLDISPQALVLCSVSSLIVNFSAIKFSSFLSTSHYILLAAMILLAASAVTWYNHQLFCRRQYTTTTETSTPAIEDLPEIKEPKIEAPIEPIPVFEDVEEDISPDTHENILEDTIEDIPENVTKDIIEDVTEDTIEDVTENTTEDAIEDIPEDVTKDTTEDVPEAISTDIAESIPEDTEETVEEVTEEVILEPEPEEIIKPVASIEENPMEEQVEAIDKLPETKVTAENIPEIEEIAEESEKESPESKNTTVHNAIEPSEELVAIVAAKLNMDDLLDFAFEQSLLHNNSNALYAYSEALHRYRDDSYAPFIVIEMINICKAAGAYEEAMEGYNNAMSLPAVMDNPDMQKEFKNGLSYIKSIIQVLEDNAMANTPLKDIPPVLMREIEQLFAIRRIK